MQFEIEIKEFEPYVPIKSLKYKCLAVLASILRREDTKTTASITCLSSITESITDLNLPLDIVQLIIDHMAMNNIPIKHRALCALLANGGCFSLHRSVFSKSNSKENKQILDILAENCKKNSLRSLTLHWCDIPCEEIPSFKLRSLSLGVKSLDDLFMVFLSFPNLIELNVYGSFTRITIQQMNNFYEEYKKPIYNKIRHSIRKLRLSFSKMNNFFENKLISYFPNLIQLGCYLNEKICDAIQRALYTGYMEDVAEDGLIVTANELKNLSSIFSQLQALIIGSNGLCDFSVLTPNLQKLDMFCANNVGNSIDKLCFLKSFSLLHQFEKMELILKQIGHNLECLELPLMESVIDVSTIARYCPNLKHFILGSTEDISFFNELERPFRLLKTFQFYRPSIWHEGRDYPLALDVGLICYILKHAINIEHLEIRVSEICNEDFTKLFQNIQRDNLMANLRVLIVQEIDYGSMSEHLFSQLIKSFDKLCYAHFINQRTNN